MRLILLTTLLLLSHITHSATLSAGIKTVGVQLGTASVGSEQYTTLGASINYFAIENLSVGAGYEYWFSGTPTVSKASLTSTYYIPASQEIKPYIGLLYSHYFVEDYSDVDSYGYRAGVAYIKSPLLFSAGIKQEKYMSDGSVFSDNGTTGEFVLGFTF